MAAAISLSEDVATRFGPLATPRGTVLDADAQLLNGAVVGPSLRGEAPFTQKGTPHP